MKSNTSLRHERELLGWSQARLAEELGTTATNIGRWERGVSYPIPYFQEKLCTLFGKNARMLGLLREDKREDKKAAAPDLSSKMPEPVATEAVALILDPTIPIPGLGARKLIGRQSVLQRIKQTLATREGLSLFALHGLPGVGKTTLAVALAYDREARPYFSDGILWAGLGPQPDLQRHLSRWGALLGLSLKATQQFDTLETWVMSIRGAIGSRQMLIVIDDAWELEAALACQVGGPQCIYLVTTRFPQVAVSFAGSGAMILPELSEKDGVELLECYAPEVIKQDATAAHHLVQAVGGLPLALTLLGKYLQGQAYSGQPRRLQRAIEQTYTAQYRLHLGLPQFIDEYHPGLQAGTALSLQSVISISDQQLDTVTQRALRALAVFPAKPGSFSEEGALVVSDAPVEVLDTLSDSGLLESNGAGRYTLHQVIADYARTNSESIEDDTAAQKRLVAYVGNFTEQHQTDYPALEMESNTILTALESASTRGWDSEQVKIICAFAPFLYMRGLYALAEQHLQRAYEAANAMEDSQGLSSVTLHLGEIMRKRGDYAQAEKYYQEGLSLARQIDDQERMSVLLRGLGVVAEMQGNDGQAEAAYQEGLALARQSGHDERISLLLSDLGVLLGAQGNYAQAEVRLQEGLDLARKLELREGMSTLLTSLGWVATEQGNHAQAEVYLQEGLSIARQMGGKERVGGLLWALGKAAAEQGHYTQAEAYLQEGLSIARNLDHRELISYMLSKLAMVAIEQGAYAQAETYLREGLELARQIGHRELTANMLQSLGSIALKRGDYPQAKQLLEEGLAIARHTGHRGDISEFLANLGMLEAEQGDNVQAETFLQEGLELAREINHRERIGHLLTNLCIVAIKRGDAAQAETYLQEGLALEHAGITKVLYCNLLLQQGELCLLRQQPGPAARTFSEALALVPAENQEVIAQAHFGLARAASRSQSLQEARGHGDISLSIYEGMGHHAAHEVRAWLAAQAADENQVSKK